MRNFSGALSKLQVISSNSDWFILLFAPVMISNNYNNYSKITLLFVFQQSFNDCCKLHLPQAEKHFLD